jgi:ABC-2 type transport system permease protein
VQAGLESAGIAPERALRLANPPPLPVQSLKPLPRNHKTNPTGKTSALYGLILTYVLLAQFGTWLLIGVVEEKSSRVIEVLLSTLRPRQLLAGKVIGIGAVALLQAGLIVAVALGLGAAEGSTLIHGSAPLGVLSSLLWVVLGYAFYCWVYAAGGSLADRQEQVQSLAFPLQLPILFGYIVSLTALGSSQPSELVKVLAYLPPTAPFAMPALVALGAVTWWQFTLSVVLMLVATVLVSRLASAVYKRAILRTGGRVHLRQLFASGAA